MNEYNQFDRFVADLQERQYEPLCNKPIAETYCHAGDLWYETMNTVPDIPAKIKRYTRTNEEENTPKEPTKSPNIPRGRSFLTEKYGQPFDGVHTVTLERPAVMENVTGKELFGGVLLFTTVLTVNENTGAPTLYSYTLTNTAVRDVQVVLDFSRSRGVVAVGTESGLERSNLICVVLKAKETHLSACLKPKKKKKQFSWENDSDDEDEGRNGRKNKNSTRIHADLQLKWLTSREVSFQLLTETISAVYNVRGETDMDYYFCGRPNENVFEWVDRQEEAAAVDGIAPALVLGRMIAYLKQGARDYATSVLKTAELAGITGALILVRTLKAALRSMYGAHNESLLVCVDAGATMQIKDLLSADAMTYGQDQIEKVAQRRVGYQNIEPYGPRLKNAPAAKYGRAVRNYPRNPEGWPRTLPYVAAMPIYGRGWQSHHSGTTALHIACKKGHLPVTKTLLKHGWKLNCVDYSGQTPIEIAHSNGHIRLYKYLFQQHWKRATNDTLPASPVVQILRDSRDTKDAILQALEATNRVAENMDAQGLLGMNQLSEFLEAVKESSNEATTLSEKAKVMAETVNGKNALEEKSEDESSTDNSDEEVEETEMTEETKEVKTIKQIKTKETTETKQDEPPSKTTADTMVRMNATNYDMVNLWHVLYAGDVDCATSAIRFGYRLQYMTNVGWQAIPNSKTFINYGIANKKWTRGGGLSLVHALVCHEYEFPAPKLKPCLLMLLDEGYPGDLADMHGRTPADYANKYGHTAMRGVLTALVRKTKHGVKNSTTNNGTESEESSEEEDGEEEEEIVFPEEWVYTRPATSSENQILFGMCSGVAHHSPNQVVREAVLGGKSLFTHGTGERPVVGCRAKEGDAYPVRYDVDFTTRFEPSFLEKGMPDLDGLGWTCLHIACFAGQVEIVGVLLAAGWNPKKITARGQNSLDMARIMGHEGLFHALTEVLNGEYDVMVRKTTMYYNALKSYAQPKITEYAKASRDMAEQAMLSAGRVQKVYDEMKAEEDRKKAELEAAEAAKKNRKKTKKKKKKSNNTVKRKALKLQISSPEEMEQIKRKALQDAKEQEDFRNKKTFYRGRLNFRANAITPQMLTSWACGCTTINPLCAVQCKFCHVNKTDTEDKEEAERQYRAQFNYKEDNDTLPSGSWGTYTPLIYTIQEEMAMKKLALENIIRKKVVVSLAKKMKTTLKFSKKKFAPLPRIYADANFLSHMYDVVHRKDSEMSMVNQINVWLGNKEVDVKEISLNDAPPVEKEEENDGMPGQLLDSVHVLAHQATQVEIDKNKEICEWLGDSDWRPFVEEEEKEEDKEEEKEEEEDDEEVGVAKGDDEEAVEVE